MKTVIKIRDLGKRYVIQSFPRPRTLREELSGLWRSRRGNEEFWALRDFSLNIHRGDRKSVV